MTSLHLVSPVVRRSITSDSIFQKAVGVGDLNLEDPFDRLQRAMILGHHASREARRNMAEMNLGKTVYKVG